MASQLSAFERCSTGARVTAYLRRRITEGAFQPGQRLNELALASELGVSRSPIREALLQLAAEGLATVVPYKGTFVTRLRKQGLRDLLDFRVALEQFAVRRAIERATPQDLQRFEALVGEIRRRARAKDFAGAVDADLQAHELLVAMAASPLLTRTFRSLLGEFRLYVAATSRHYRRIGELASEHAALVAALRKRQLSTALATLERHIKHGFASTLRELE